MKCCHCEADSLYREWKDTRRCKSCGRRFVFVPRAGDPFSDVAFQKAIDAVSAEGRVRWGVEHLYYALDRRHGKAFDHRNIGVFFMLAPVVLSAVAVVTIPDEFTRFVTAHPLVAGVVAAALFITGLVEVRRRSVMSTLGQSRFDRLYARWTAEHGPPPGVIERRPGPQAAPEVEADVGDYSFDRAVICDRARTVDLLLANHFHFENNCAILSVDGYPQGPFETVRAMLKRNPRLAVYALHDATPRGCRLARLLAQDPDWFAGQTVVVDVGLRPVQAEALQGPFLPGRPGDVGTEPGLSAWEAKWLAKYRLELAVIRPEQVVKRLFRAINQPLNERPNVDNVIILPHQEPPPQKSRNSSDSTGSGDSGGGDGDGCLTEEAGDADGAIDAFG